MTNVYFEDIENIIKQNLTTAKSDIKIAVAWITNTEIIKVLEESIDKGIDVNIIFYNDNINKLYNFEKIYNKGGKINCTSNLMHNKFCIIDNRIVINGSYNWTISAKSNKENIQITDSYELAKKFEEEFIKILKKSNKTDFFFEKKIDSFNEYFDKILKPQKYPVFYKIEFDNLIKNSISNSLRDVTVTRGINFTYKLFKSEKDFLTFHKNKHNQHLPISTTNFNQPQAQAITYFKKNNSSGHIAYMPIDIILQEEILNISKLTVDEYINNNNYFRNEKLIYLDELEKKNFFIIGVKGNQRKKLEEKIMFISLKRDGDFLNSIEFEFNSFNTNNKYLIISPLHSEERKNYFYIENLEYDLNHSNSEHVKYTAELTYRREIHIKEKDALEKKKRIEEYKKKTECYLATMVYKDENHLNIIKLRTIRDEILLNYFWGRIFIKIYYKISPVFVEIFKENRFINQFIKFIIEKLIL